MPRARSAYARVVLVCAVAGLQVAALRPRVSRRDVAGMFPTAVGFAAASLAAPASAQDVRTPTERQYELYVAAMRCESAADLEGAERTWSRLIETSVPRNAAEASKVVLARAYSGRSRVRAGLGKLPPALIDISEAVGLEPDVSEFWAQRGAVFEAASRQLKGEGEEMKARQLFASAASDYDHGLMLDPRNAHLYERSGDVKVRLEDYGGALHQYMHGLELAASPAANAPLATKFALCVIQTGDIGLGSRILAEMLSQSGPAPDDELVLACAAMAWSAGSFAEAVALHHLALQRNPSLLDLEGAVDELGWPPMALDLLRDLRDRRTNMSALTGAKGGFM